MTAWVDAGSRVSVFQVTESHLLIEGWSDRDGYLGAESQRIVGGGSIDAGRSEKVGPSVGRLAPQFLEFVVRRLATLLWRTVTWVTLGSAL